MNEVDRTITKTQRLARTAQILAIISIFFALVSIFARVMSCVTKEHAPKPAEAPIEGKP
jgi:hypothetical protein